MSSVPDMSFIPDVPNGPLDEYRKRTKFEWKKLRYFFEGGELLKLKYMTWDKIESNPLFAKPKQTLPADEQKRIAAIQMNAINDLNLAPPEIENMTYRDRMRYLMSINEAVHSVCPSLSVKIAIGVGLFNNALLAMGTERHLKYYEAARNGKAVNCLAITEVSHGSNTKRIRTTAKYDPQTEEFIIDTPDFEAAKCWVGNLGKTATIALTFAILYTSDGQNHGLHGFLIPIRDPNTLKPYPGVLVGDIGEKIGLNGIDNGFVMFNNYRIPRENLLNRTGDVTPEGMYESVFSEPTKILGAALESFSAGRLGIMQESTNTLSQAAVIAIRYAAIRKQFGSEINGPETPIIEYQLHQWRLFPYLAASCVLKISVATLTDNYLNAVMKSRANINGFEQLSKDVAEIHSLVSCSKPLLTWTARDAIQEAREACGGHGYLRASNLGELRNNHDPSCTYEGDNNVLGQQASNWLIRQLENGVENPNGTANFLTRKDDILKGNFDSIKLTYSLNNLKFIIACYEWLLCWLISTTSDQMLTLAKNGRNKIEARNETQVYKARDLSRAYAEYYALKSYHDRLQFSDASGELSPILNLIGLVYGFWCMEKHLPTFYQGCFATGALFADTIRQEHLKNCAEMKDNAVSIADALAPPDFVLNSVIAKSDGLLYQNLQNEFMTNPNALERATWWREVRLPIAKSKL